jgi:hypothetical protein
MDLINRDALSTLARHDDAPCVSLYMSTFRFESDLSQNPIRYKNLLKEARDQLRAEDHSDDAIDALLADARARLDDTPLWRKMSLGMAVFISPSTTRLFRLPLAFDEMAIVGKRFHLKPLFPLIATNNRFYLLALSQNDVRLFQGTHQAISEVGREEIPSGIVEAIRQYEDPEKSLQHHTANRAGQGEQGRGDQAFHGQGVTSDDLASEAQSEIKRYFGEVAERVEDRLAGEDAPLVLAAVREHLPLYREANDYPHLVTDDIVQGNPEPLSMDELHNQAWGIVEPLFLEAQTEALEQFNQQYHQDELASTDVHEIVPAAAYSRIHTLFVPVGEHRWGRYDAQANTVELHDGQAPGTEDLLNYAAVHAFLNGATVHALKPANMPNGFGVAALFRYPADVSATENGAA